jgi:hypothetical protein
MASSMTKSPVALARAALWTASRVLPAYSCRTSRHTYTQPQIFAILTLRSFFRTDYRGICDILRDFSDLREVLRLPGVPHFTTLQKAEARLLKRGLLTPSWEPCSTEPESFISFVHPSGG